MSRSLFYGIARLSTAAAMAAALADQTAAACSAGRHVSGCPHRPTTGWSALAAMAQAAETRHARRSLAVASLRERGW